MFIRSSRKNQATVIPRMMATAETTRRYRSSRRCSNRVIEPSGGSGGGFSHFRLKWMGRPLMVSDTTGQTRRRTSAHVRAGGVLDSGLRRLLVDVVSRVRLLRSVSLTCGRRSCGGLAGAGNGTPGGGLRRRARVGPDGRRFRRGLGRSGGVAGVPQALRLFLELLERTSGALSETGEPGATEQQQHDHQDDDQLR